jgi:hypothetical protein
VAEKELETGSLKASQGHQKGHRQAKRMNVVVLKRVKLWRKRGGRMI